MSNIKDIFIDFYSKIHPYKILGIKETKYANLIGRAPHIGKQAWLHAIYKPITKKEIEEMNSKLCVQIPKIYEDFLMLCNGLSVFGTTLSLFGYRYNYIRDIENIWQPFDIIDANNRDRPHNAQDNHFFFGFYNWDGSNLFINTDTLKIYRCTEESVSPLNEWEDFGEMLLSETDRLIRLFDKNGVKIDVDKETIPPR